MRKRACLDDSVQNAGDEQTTPDDSIELPRKMPRPVSLEANTLAKACGDSACILRPPHKDEVFGHLGRALRAGSLVAFPTETVYGLGANGLDATAVLKIFEAKGRPLTDPCILHVSSSSAALPLLELSEDERAVFDVLTESCWPGPLSLVARAAPCVPREVTAGTDFVAVRCPAHPIAQRLLIAGDVPVAAPSANRFGHISPTTAEHVLADLNHWEGLRILDGGQCGVGIESSVVKLELPHRVVMLRKGGATKERLEAVLAQAMRSGKLTKTVAVEYPTTQAQAPKTDESEAQISPGLLLRHYAPSLQTALLSVVTAAGPGEAPKALPERSILIDYHGQFSGHHGLFLKTFDLTSEESSKGDASSSHAEEACTRIFAVLRAAEAAGIEAKAELICIADFPHKDLGGYIEALHDRVFRAASGRKIGLYLHGDKPCFVALLETGAR